MSCDLPEEVLDVPDEDDFRCGRNDEEDEVLPDDCLRVIDAAAQRIDAEAFAAPPVSMAQARRRDEARRKAREVYLLFEAARAGIPLRAAA